MYVMHSWVCNTAARGGWGPSLSRKLLISIINPPSFTRISPVEIMLTLIDDFVNDGNIPPEGSNVYLSWPPWVILVAAMSEFMKIYAPGLGLHASTAMGTIMAVTKPMQLCSKLRNIT